MSLRFYFNWCSISSLMFQKTTRRFQAVCTKSNCVKEAAKFLPFDRRLKFQPDFTCQRWSCFEKKFMSRISGSTAAADLIVNSTEKGVKFSGETVPCCFFDVDRLSGFSVFALNGKHKFVSSVDTFYELRVLWCLLKERRIPCCLNFLLLSFDFHRGSDAVTVLVRRAERTNFSDEL